MHEKAKQLTEKTKEILKKKDSEIAILKKEIIARGSEIPKYTLMQRGIRPDNKTEMLIFVSKQKVNLRDQEIDALKNHIQKLNRTTKESALEKNPISDIPKDVEIKNFPEIQRVKVENHRDIQKVKIVGEGVQKVQVINHEKSGPWAVKIALLAVEGITGMFAKLWSKGLSVKVENEIPLKVVVVDILGRPIKQHPATIIPLGSMGGGARKDESPSRQLISGQITIPTAGDILPLGVDTARSVTVKALSTNNGLIYIGGPTVSSTTGFELEAGDTASADIGFLANYYFTSSVDGEGISFFYIK